MTPPERSADCEAASRQLFDLRDGVRDEDAAALRAHLEVCPACRHDLVADERLGRLLGTSPIPAAPTGLAVAVRRRVRRRRLQRASGIAVAAAVALLVGFVGWREWSRPGDPGPVAVRPVTPPAANGTDDLPEAALLFDPPPVDSFDRVTRQQAGYVAAMQQLKKE